MSPDDPTITRPRVPGRLTGQARTAPILTVLVDAATAPRVRGLPADERLRLVARLDGVWVRIGGFTSSDRGRAILPAFRVDGPGLYLMRVPLGDDRYKYLKVRARINE